MVNVIQPRGIRNNNPGNIEYNSRTLWNGLAKPPSDGRFCRFIAPQYGLRVLSKLLLAYHDYHDCRTVQDYINRWAPSVENNTSAYVTAVANDMGITSTVIIDINDIRERARMMYGIVRHENGEQPYSMDALIAACEMA